MCVLRGVHKSQQQYLREHKSTHRHMGKLIANNSILRIEWDGETVPPFLQAKTSKVLEDAIVVAGQKIPRAQTAQVTRWKSGEAVEELTFGALEALRTVQPLSRVRMDFDLVHLKKTIRSSRTFTEGNVLFVVPAIPKKLCLEPGTLTQFRKAKISVGGKGVDLGTYLREGVPSHQPHENSILAISRSTKDEREWTTWEKKQVLLDELLAAKGTIGDGASGTFLFGFEYTA